LPTACETPPAPPFFAAAAPFPEAVDANEKELADISQREATLRSRPDFAKLAEGAVPAAASESESLEGKGKNLSEALESLPEILAKKMNLEAHTNILQAVMKKIENTLEMYSLLGRKNNIKKDN
jgi:hypothetical protein